MEAMQTTADRAPYWLRRQIQVIKEAIPIEQVATEYGEYKLSGSGRLLGRCLSPLHEDRTPSMTVFTDTQRFKCFGCGLSGDVIDIEELAGYHADTWTAVVSLSVRYGIELPQRPGRWSGWQAAKTQRREQLRRLRAELYQRRMFKLYFADYIAAIEEPDEREQEAEQVWEQLWAVVWGWTA